MIFQKLIKYSKINKKILAEWIPIKVWFTPFLYKQSSQATY